MADARPEDRRRTPRVTDAAAALSAVEEIAAALDPLGPRVLVTGPPGSGRSRLVLAAFDAAMEREGPDRVLLVLPTYGQVEHQKRVAISRREERRLARAILDAPYATFTSLAERLSPEFRVRDLPTSRERDLLAAEALRRADVALFRAVADRPGFRGRFLRLVKELKQTGQPPARIAARLAAASGALSPAARERLEGFLAAWAAYEALLEASGCPDHEDVLRGLLEATTGASGALSHLALLVVDGFEDLTGVEASLLDAATRAVTTAGGRVLVTLPHDPARPTSSPATVPLRARLLRTQGFVEHACDGFPRASAPGLVRLATHLFLEADRAPDPAEPGNDVRSLVGADEADEWDRVGREILRLRREEPQVVRSFRDVGVVCRRLDGVGIALQRAFAALGIPSRLHGGGARLSSEAVARALRGPLHVVGGRTGEGEREFDGLRVLEYLRWRALASGRPVPLDPVDALEARWREEGPATTWALAREDLVAASAALGAAADELEAWRLEATRARGAVEVWSFLGRAVQALLPLPASPGLDGEGRPKDPEGDARLRRAVGARERLAGLASEAARAARRTGLEGDLGVDEAVAAFDALTDETVLAPSDRRLDTVHLLDAEEARHWELPVVFVVGLVEKAFPLHPMEDVFLRDEDRAALAERLGQEGGSPPWRTALHAEQGERRLFLSAVTRARRRLYLTRSAADENGRARAPSFFWREVNRALGLVEEGGPRLGRVPEDLGRRAIPPEAAVRVEDLDRAVAVALGAPARPQDEERVREAVALARVRGPAMADLWARAGRFLRPDADPLAPLHARRFSASVATVSPTALTAGRACLHRFFLTRVVGLRGDAGAFTGPVYDRRLYGSLVHRALELALREPEAAADELARRVATERAEALREPADVAWVESDLARIVTLFRAREERAKASGYEPRLGDLEWRFGRRGPQISLGSGEGAFFLEGALDRLDTSTEERGARRAIVVDYKTSPTSAKNAARKLRDLEDLQLPLYARAVEGLRGVTVVGLEHYAATRRERVLVGSVVASAALEARTEGKVAPSVLPVEAFRDLIEGAERRAVDVVLAVRARDHGKRPLARGECGACDVRAVCRPDTSRFRARRDEGEEDA